MARRRPSIRRRKRTIRILFGVCGAVFAFMIYRYMSFNSWMYKDARLLQPYPHVLIENGNSHYPTRTASETVQEIEKTLVKANTTNRLVVHLSRSDIRFSPFRRWAYVKVFMETALPGEPDRVQRIKFLNELKRTDEGWIVVDSRTVQLTLP